MKRWTKVLLIVLGLIIIVPLGVRIDLEIARFSLILGEIFLYILAIIPLVTGLGILAYYFYCWSNESYFKRQEKKFRKMRK